MRGGFVSTESRPRRLGLMAMTKASSGLTEPDLSQLAYWRSYFSPVLLGYRRGIFLFGRLKKKGGLTRGSAPNLGTLSSAPSPPRLGEVASNQMRRPST